MTIQKRAVFKTDKRSILFLVTLLLFSGCEQRSDLEKNLMGSSLYEHQWYLHNTGQNAGAQTNGTAGEDLNLSNVWDSYQGEGVTIGIVDTGIEARHIDLMDNLSASYGGSYKNGQIYTSDPSPIDAQLYDKYDPEIDIDNSHGTNCAGIAAAVGDNGFGVTGVAPKATLVGLNAFADTTSDQFLSFADALYNANRPVDISSNSWNDGVGNIDETSVEFIAVKNGALSGRNGLGTIYCFAAGNERTKQHNANWHRELNNPYVITIAALDADGIYAIYSNKGANILISGFGGEDGDYYPAIVSTDLMGELGLDRKLPFDVAGNENGDYTNLMNGTSAATPMVAGVVALLLDANPNLTYRDVRYILATTARKNDPEDYTGDWVQNGAGYWINHSYGFGAVNVAGAVKKAETFTPGLDANQTLSVPSGDLNITLGSQTAYTSELNVSTDLLIEHIEVELTLTHGYPEDLTIILTSPDETNSTLTSPTDVDNLYPNFFNSFTLGSVRHLDEHTQGTWKLTILDKKTQSPRTYNNRQWTDSGTLIDYRLTFYGRQP